MIYIISNFFRRKICIKVARIKNGKLSLTKFLIALAIICIFELYYILVQLFDFTHLEKLFGVACSNIVDLLCSRGELSNPTATPLTIGYSATGLHT
jgi:hypothetical protein